MPRVNIDIKPITGILMPTDLATRQYRTTMAHDTGSEVLTLFTDEVQAMYRTTISQIPFVSAELLILASGATWVPFFYVQLRIITPDCSGCVLDWQIVRAAIVPRTAHAVRLSPRILEEKLYTCMVPKCLDLYVGIHKTAMIEDVPAGLQL